MTKVWHGKHTTHDPAYSHFYPLTVLTFLDVAVWNETQDHVWWLRRHSVPLRCNGQTFGSHARVPSYEPAYDLRRYRTRARSRVRWTHACTAYAYVYVRVWRRSRGAGMRRFGSHAGLKVKKSFIQYAFLLYMYTCVTHLWIAVSVDAYGSRLSVLCRKAQGR